jgi:hypothetical protein
LIRTAAFVAGVLGIGMLLGARSPDPNVADPVRAAGLVAEAASLAASADAALADAETFMRTGTDEARSGQQAIRAGDEDPAVAFTVAGGWFEAAAGPVGDARDPLRRLGWTLYALDPDAGLSPPGLPSLEVTPDDLVAIGAQWRATALPASALADVRRAAEDALESLDDALAALAADDFAAALVAADEAEAALDEVRAFEGDVDRVTLDFWVGTVQALIDATRGMAAAAAAGDQAALGAARVDYAAAAAEASRADQALVIALGEAAARLTLPASAASADAQREVRATRDRLAALSILP